MSYRMGEHEKRAMLQPPPEAETRDPVFVHLVFQFAVAISEMIDREHPPNDFNSLLRRGPGDEPPDEGGLSKSGVPRRPPDKSGSGFAEQIEPTEQLPPDADAIHPQG